MWGGGGRGSSRGREHSACLECCLIYPRRHVDTLRDRLKARSSIRHTRPVGRRAELAGMVPLQKHKHAEDHRPLYPLDDVPRRVSVNLPARLI